MEDFNLENFLNSKKIYYYHYKYEHNSCKNEHENRIINSNEIIHIEEQIKFILNNYSIINIDEEGYMYIDYDMEYDILESININMTENYIKLTYYINEIQLIHSIHNLVNFNRKNKLKIRFTIINKEIEFFIFNYKKYVLDFYNNIILENKYKSSIFYKEIYLINESANIKSSNNLEYNSIINIEDFLDKEKKEINFYNEFLKLKFNNTNDNIYYIYNDIQRLYINNLNDFKLNDNYNYYYEYIYHNIYNICDIIDNINIIYKVKNENMSNFLKIEYYIKYPLGLFKINTFNKYINALAYNCLLIIRIIFLKKPELDSSIIEIHNRYTILNKNDLNLLKNKRVNSKIEELTYFNGIVSNTI